MDQISKKILGKKGNNLMEFRGNDKIVRGHPSDLKAFVKIAAHPRTVHVPEAGARAQGASTGLHVSFFTINVFPIKDLYRWEYPATLD
jgi:hypothetical protein